MRLWIGAARALVTFIGPAVRAETPGPFWNGFYAGLARGARFAVNDWSTSRF
jgi:hypothetical protein